MRFLSMFSGIGSPERALSRLKIPHEIIAFAEIDKYAKKAYSLLHNISEELNLGDVTVLDETKVPDVDFIFYSPPCQSFSFSGKQLGFGDERGVLFFDALRVIKHKQPKYAVMENVEGLTQKKFQKEFKVMLEQLDLAGYNNYWQILDAKLYGIPQSRKRVFIVSIRKDIDDETFKFPEPIPLKYELKELLESDAELPILHNIYGGFKETKPRVFEDYSPTIRTSRGGGHIPSVFVKGASLRSRNYRGQPQKLEIRKDEVSNTVTTVAKDAMIAFYMDGKEVEYPLNDLPKGYKFLNGYLIRELKPIEAFRLMNFDDRDCLILQENGISKTQLLKMAGNSIVVGVLEEIFKPLLVGGN